MGKEVGSGVCRWGVGSGEGERSGGKQCRKGYFRAGDS